MARRRPLAVLAATLAAVTLTACAENGGGSLPLVAAGANRSASATPLAGDIVGFGVDTPKRVANAARDGIDVTILYGGSPAPGSALGKALAAHHIAVIDAGVSQELSAWECHRTHTVAPPPKGSTNDYCATDYKPSVSSDAVVLRYVEALMARDARRPYTIGYWVLDDWPWWDPGSGRQLLQSIHAEIVKATPGLPAVCGFGAGLSSPGRVSWNTGTAKNYSNGGCDAVGWYNYSPFGRTTPSLGRALDWSMKALLPAMARSLGKEGWNIAQTPLLGIDQAWGGAYGARFFQPGITKSEMLAQARAFCAFGATSIGWYAWDDSGFGPKTLTPQTSPVVTAGIQGGIAACRTIWN